MRFSRDRSRDTRRRCHLVRCCGVCRCRVCRDHRNSAGSGRGRSLGRREPRRSRGLSRCMHGYRNRRGSVDPLRCGIRFDHRGDLRDGRHGDQSPLLEMIYQRESDQNCDEGSDAQVASPASPLLRIWIDESIWRRAAETQHVAVVEPLCPANAAAIDERAGRRFEIDQVVAATLVSDDRMALRNVRIRDAQPGIFGGADRSFVARQHEQPRSLRIAIDRQQSRGLRTFQHLMATLARRVQDGRHLEDECGSLRWRFRCSRSFRAVRRWSAGVTSAPLRLHFSEILLTVILPGLVVAISGKLILLVGRHHQDGAAHFGSLVGCQAGIGQTLRRWRLFSCPERYSWQTCRCDLAVLILFPLETSCERAQADRRHD